MINPRDMTDHQLIAELQGWPPALADMKRFSWRQMGVRFKLVAEEFEDRMITGRCVLDKYPRPVHVQGPPSPSFGTAEEIEEEQERMQRIAGRHALHG